MRVLRIFWNYNKPSVLFGRWKYMQIETTGNMPLIWTRKWLPTEEYYPPFFPFNWKTLRRVKLI